jgi:DNA-binding transcriptional LysR family regulator
MRWNDRIGRRLKLSDLHILLVVAEAGSMAKAARVLCVSHPVVSRAISGLEHTLGARLLERGSNGVVTTPYGTALISRGIAAFDELRQAVKDLEFLSDPTIGEVRIGSTVPLSSSFVSAVVDKLSQKFPRLVFQLQATESATLLDELNSRKLDLLVARKFGRVAEGQWLFETLYEDPYVIVASADNPLVRRRKLDLSELIEMPWALPPPDSLFGSVVVQAFRSRGLDYPRASVICFSFEVRNSLVASGRYLTVVPQSLIRLPSRRPGIKILPVQLPTPYMPIGLVTLRDRDVGPVARIFMKEAKALASELQKGSGGRQR